MTKETGGRFNLFKVVGALLVMGSVPACVYVAAAESGQGASYGVGFTLVLGFVLFIIGRFAD